MPERDTHGLGYFRVDEDPNVLVLLGTMDATARWEAIVQLRGWEREQLNLTASQRLLDVGCGLGDAALELVADLDSTSEVVGIDVSAEMIAGAQLRARSARCRVRFAIGDALELKEPAGSFDVVRSERTLQWLADPERAAAEMVRMLKPGGLLSLIDTDWSSLQLDVGDAELSTRIREAMKIERRRPSNIGRRLTALVEGLGLELVSQTLATQRWTAWNPDESPAPDGCFSMSSLANDLVEAGQLDIGEQERFVATIHDAAREDRFSMALTMHAVVATTTRPSVALACSTGPRSVSPWDYDSPTAARSSSKSIAGTSRSFRAAQHGHGAAGLRCSGA